MKVGDPLDAETQMGSLISTAHREKVHGFVEGAASEGAEVTTGGAIGDGPGAFYPPTVIARADNAMRAAQEEIFGPVVTVIPFEDEADAVRIANDVKYGLMATVWTGDPAPRAPRRREDQVRDGRDQHAVHRVPRDPVRRLQAVRLRPRARRRDARPLPRDEVGRHVHRHAADEPVRAVAAGLRTAGPSSPRARSRRRRTRRSGSASR